MKFLVTVKVSINKPFAFWKSRFDEHAATRRAAGIIDVFCAPVVGEQSILYCVKTDTPRLIHDMIYETAIREHVEASGHIIGSEQMTLCECMD